MDKINLILLTIILNFFFIKAQISVNYTKNKTSCDSIEDETFFFHEDYDACILNECQEYPEISPGCIVCKNKLDEYKIANKCQRCKYGYFKTKDGKCIYCASEQYGGPACRECEYQKDAKGIESDNIICKVCPNGNYGDIDFWLSSDGKCYDCLYNFKYFCTKCSFENKGKDFQCDYCIQDYFRTSEGLCVGFSSLVKRIPNCELYYFKIENIEFALEIDSEYEYVNVYADQSEEDYEETLKRFFNDEIKGPIESNCSECDYGYRLTEAGNCEEEDLSFNSLIKYFNENPYYYYYFCDRINWVTIEINGVSISSLAGNNLNESLNKLGEYLDKKACLSNTGEGGEDSPYNLKYCQKAIYYPNNNTYVCIFCSDGTYLDKETHLCYHNKFKNIKITDCQIENKGNELFPDYSCTTWYKTYYYTLVTTEKNETGFTQRKYSLEGCSEARINTTYLNPKYNCTKCLQGYNLTYSKFYDQIICYNNNLNKTIEEKEFPYNLFNKAKKVKAKNGICEKDYLFTPDGEYCYKCNDELVGMPGCKGKCSYSLKRNQTLKCEGTCRTGYIESSEGVCTYCNDINKGCYKCHYETNYPDNYLMLKRERRFVCDYCQEGYAISNEGYCLDCYNDLSLKNCDKCENDPNIIDNYICSKCKENYFVNVKGECEKCEKNYFKGFKTNKCVRCSDTSEGGIDKCFFCSSDGTKVTCEQCSQGYILRTNDNTCLQIIINKELHKFELCLQVTLENNKLECSKCWDWLSSIKKSNGNRECVDFYDIYEFYLSDIQYYYYYISSNITGVTYYDRDKDLEYLYRKYSVRYPCQEVENLGSEDNPLYSCIKCYEGPEEQYLAIKIIEEYSKLSYCLNSYYYNEIKNCSEVLYKIKDGKEIYNCTKCHKYNALIYNKTSNTLYCQYTMTKCSVLYCQTCNHYNGYICEQCFPDYEINKFSGSCVKKTEIVPSITWKDIYGLIIDTMKIINNIIIYGPSLRLIGITSSQINLRHAFIIYLTFITKISMRNLEEKKIKIPTLCEIIEAVDETSNDVNMIEYECIGNYTNSENLTNYILVNIEEGNNEGILNTSNLNDLASSIELGNLIEKIDPEFSLENLMKIVFFEMDNNNETIRANDFKFNFVIKGKLNKDLGKGFYIHTKFNLSEIDNKANCLFEVGENKTANLSCDLNVENHKDIRTFSFKTSQIQTTEGDEINFVKLNDLILINSVEKKDKSKKKLIIIVVICSVVGVIGIGLAIFFIVGCLKSKKDNIETKNNDKGKEEVKRYEVKDNDKSKNIILKP